MNFFLFYITFYTMSSVIDIAKTESSVALNLLIIALNSLRFIKKTIMIEYFLDLNINYINVI